jgi:hypothetical protein
VLAELRIGSKDTARDEMHSGELHDANSQTQATVTPAN